MKPVIRFQGVPVQELFDLAGGSDAEMIACGYRLDLHDKRGPVWKLVEERPTLDQNGMDVKLWPSNNQK